jgi:hypothetical protein
MMMLRMGSLFYCCLGILIYHQKRRARRLLIHVNRVCAPARKLIVFAAAPNVEE